MEYLIYLNNEPVRRICGDDAAGAIYADMCSLADLFHCSAAICNIISSKDGSFQMEYLIYLNNVPIRRVSGDDIAGAIYADMCSLADLFHCSAALCNASNNMILNYHMEG